VSLFDSLPPPAVQMKWMRRLKPVLFLALLSPFLISMWRLYAGQIFDPVEELTHISGEFAIRCLILCLAVTPLRILTGFGAIITLRRMLGLFAFFYAACHLTVYVWLDQYFAWDDIVEDILERRYIFVGFLAFVVMVPLAATSFDRAIRKLGAARWNQLHKLVYVSAIAAILHYLWLVKVDYTAPIIHGVIIGILLLIRVIDWRRRSAKQAARRAARKAG